MKKPLTALTLAAAAVATLAVPAGAAVPKTPPTATLKCGSRTARVWNTGTFVAVDNRCTKQWLILSYVVASQSSPATFDRSFAPGVHFRHDGWNMTDEGRGSLFWRLAVRPQCGGEVFHRHGKPSGLPC